MMKVIFTLILLTSTLLTANSQAIRINEIVADNTSFPDQTGAFSDWFELRNLNNEPYDLAGHYISDKTNNLTKFQFSLTPGLLVIPANGYLIIWASGTPLAGNNHTNFSLSSSNGEAVVLTKPDGTTIIDQFVFPAQRQNVSIGKSASNVVKYYSPASPGQLNNISNEYDGFLDPPSFSRNGGFFNSSFSLTLSHSDSGVSIYYTIDGSDPSPSNLSGTTYSYKNSYPETPSDPFGPLLTRSYVTQSYINPILIADRTSTPNQISTINATIAANPTYIPNYNIEKGTVIRAIAIKPGLLPSEIQTQTYIYSSTGNNPYSFPVTSVATQENNLFEYEYGIYTAGKVFDNYRLAHPYEDLTWCPPGNFQLNGGSAERSGNFEFFENNQPKVNQRVGIRIQGSCSAKNKYKSLRFYGTNGFDEFGFFDEAPNLYHQRIMLRNSGNDQVMTIFKDEFAREWLKHLNFGSQKSKPSILFLNGEYWGIHNIRERIDKYYLQALFGANPENIDLRKVNYFEPDEMSEGDDVHFNYTYNYIMNNNVSITSVLDHIETLVDLESFIDFHIAHLFIGNIDWPQNNVRLWRSKNTYDANAGYLDGRWRYIFFDADRGLGEIVGPNNNDLNDVFYRENSELLAKLLTNNDFKNRFITRYADLLNTSFRPEFGLTLFTSMKNLYLPEISKHIQRWKTHIDITAWENQCDIVETYVSHWKNNVYNHINYKFGTTGTFNLTVLSQNLNYGFVQVNSLKIDTSFTRGLSMSGRSWTGAYFKNIPFKIRAVPRPGYKFTHWMHNGNPIYTQEILISTSTSRTYEAFFEYTGLSDNPFPIAKSIKECGYKLNYWSGSSPSGTYPANGAFIYMNKEENPRSTALENTLTLTTGAYNLTSDTRINGLGNEGFSFINTGEGNSGYPQAKLGGFVLAINTVGVEKVSVKWVAKTIKSNSRKYKIRLVYRVGDIENFIPLGTEYASGTDGHTQVFDSIYLPANALNKEYVQLLWQYYDTRLVTSGKRDELAISEIVVGEEIVRPENINAIVAPNYPLKIQSTENIANYRQEFATGSILLLPGFKANKGTVFKAEIKTCP